jgi:UDP-glucose 6-dehydrogenase
MKVLFFNAMYDLIEKSWHDYYTMIEWVTADKRIGDSHSNILFPSWHNQAIAWRWAGGHCFIKDYQALLDFYFENLGTTLGYKMLESAKEYNIHLLRSTNKDLDILRQTYEN